MPKHVLVSGGAGFVGSSIALALREEFDSVAVTAMDNLYRQGSELNLPRLRDAGISFLKGDVRSANDWENCGKCDLIIECSAEPSVLAGIAESPEYMVHTNLTGTLHALEHARKHHAAFLFLSTSRVYPLEVLNALKLLSRDTRFELDGMQSIPGVSIEGVSEDFPILGVRSLYGATKFASEIMVQEYAASYGIPALILRCGVIAGPWQMGKVDQGVLALWVARHLFGGSLSYIGYGGQGLQVRDLLHIGDLCRLVLKLLGNMEEFKGQSFNLGGGKANALSLRELTIFCEHATANSLNIQSIPGNRINDIPWYISDNTRITAATGWAPVFSPEKIIEDTVIWLRNNEKQLRQVFNSV